MSIVKLAKLRVPNILKIIKKKAIIQIKQIEKIMLNSSTLSTTN